jgi:prevent-host-death family protein
MAEPAVPLQRRRIELPLVEARTRLTQIVRLTPVTGQVTVITDRGRPVAAIVPIAAVPSDEPAAPAAGRSESTAAGWMRRIEQVREAVRRQHVQRTTELEHALTNVWAVLDRLRPQGADRAVDELRIAHRDVLARQPPSTDSPTRSN